MESLPGKDAVKVVERTTKYLKYYVNLVDTSVAGVERTDSNSERSYTVSKMLSNSTTHYREIVRDWKSQSRWQTLLLLVLRNCHRKPNLWQLLPC